MDPRIVLMVGEAYRHAKALGGWAEPGHALEAAGYVYGAPGVVIGEEPQTILEEITGLLARHRVWERFTTQPGG